MKGWLLDVNILLGCSWKSHADHSALLDWLLQADEWATCPITELGFVRVSMTTTVTPFPFWLLSRHLTSDTIGT